MGNKASYTGYGQSQFLRAEDMVGRRARAVIENVEDTELDRGTKPALVLQGWQKKLIVNSTNYDVLANAWGDNTDGWIGQTVILRGSKTKFKNKMVDSIQVEVPPQPKQATKQAEQAPPFDDGIPDFAA
jgi:hypothetical protein